MGERGLFIETATCRNACTLRELRRAAADVDDPCLRFHFRPPAGRRRFCAPKMGNDLADWAHDSLLDRRSAEKLALLSPRDFDTPEDFRNALLAVLDDCLVAGETWRVAPPDEHFNFVSARPVPETGNDRAPGTALAEYEKIIGSTEVNRLRHLAAPLKGLKLVHVNSTKEGGGVAEILHKLVPLMRELGLDASWEVVTGEAPFYETTKAFHNGLQGDSVRLTSAMLKAYEETNEENAATLRPVLEDADIVIIHDPQPARLLGLCPSRKGTWLWRCHIDASNPHPPVWNYLRDSVKDYDASIFSIPAFAQELPHPQFLVPPSIDPLTPKNIDLPEEEVQAVRETFGLDPSRPMICQVSRYDRFKDPVGVVRAWNFARLRVPGLQLVLAGGGASDDPEGAEVLEEVRAAVGEDLDAKVLLLPADAHRTINALQRAADIVLQKSTREGFGLTVTEALWKGRPVIGGNTGGIRLQVINGRTGFLVDCPEGAALRIGQLLAPGANRGAMGTRAKEYVRENFLLTRLLGDYLSMCRITAGR